MTFEDFISIVRAEFPDVTEEQSERFRQMDGLYREWNSRINVISRKDIDGFYEHHVLHSLGIAAYWRREGLVPAGSFSVLDVGTGGGFPGIPLAVMFPQAVFTLCDSVGKKTLVAGEVAGALGLENVTVVNARASRCRTSTITWFRVRLRRWTIFIRGSRTGSAGAALRRAAYAPGASTIGWLKNIFKKNLSFRLKKTIFAVLLSNNI